MRNKKLVKVAVIQMSGLLLLIVTLSCMQTPVIDLSGNYKEVHGYNYEIRITQQADSLTGQHCFVNSTGSRIDCCAKGDGATLSLEKVSDKLFKGSIQSCYDESSSNIELHVSDSNTMYLVLDNHPFIADTVFLKKTIGE